MSSAFRPVHWVARFVRSVRPGYPSVVDRAWADGFLTDSERKLFSKMSSADQRHAIWVARSASPNLDSMDLEPTLSVAAHAAALLHDVGKTAAALGTYGRIVATLSGAVGGRDTAELWAQTSGITRRVGLYLQYPKLGADMLKLAGSHPWVVAWSREHHEGADAWSLPPEVARILVVADR